MSVLRGSPRSSSLNTSGNRDIASGAVFEQENTADLPAATPFLSPRLFLSTGATAAAVAYDCSGVYLETDY